jgi:hypothetical protein
MTTLDYREEEKRLKTKMEGHLLSERRQIARWSNWAGDIGFECDLFHVLARTKPDLMPLPEIGLLKVFAVSNMLEAPILRMMGAAGLEIVEVGRPFQLLKEKISGKIDAKVVVGDEEKIKIPLELKCLSPYRFREVAKIKEAGGSLLNAKSVWMRKYPAQIMIYDYMDGSELGAWLFYEKASGDFLPWILPIDLDYVGTLLQRAERVNEWVDKNQEPKPERKEICAGCAFERTYCFMGKDYGPGYEFLTAPEEAERVRRYLAIEETAKEAEDLWDEFKARYRGRTVILEDFKIVSKAEEVTAYRIPKEVKEPFATKEVRYRLSIEKL